MRSSAEFNEKHTKGLCFWCDKKFEAGHQLVYKKRKQIFMMEINEDSEMEVDDEGTDGNDGNDDDSTPQISVYAVTGISAKGCRTMRVTVQVGKQTSSYAY